MERVDVSGSRSHESLRPFEGHPRCRPGPPDRWRSACSALSRREVGGTLVPLGAPKLRAVLAVLALRIGSAVSTATLSGPCGATTRPRRPARPCRATSRRSAGILAPRAIETTPQGYRLVGPKDTDRHLPIRAANRTGPRAAGRRAPGLRGGRVRPRPGAVARGAIARSGRRAGRSRGGGPAPERRASAEEDLFEGRLQLGDHQGVLPDLSGRRRGGAAARTEVGAAHAGAVPLGPPGRRHAGLPAATAAVLAEEHGVEPSTEILTLEQRIVLEKPELRWTPPEERGAPIPLG